MDARIELGAVAATAAVFVALPKPPAAVAPLAVFVPACAIGWGAYLLAAARRDPTALDRWGLRPTAHLRPLLTWLAPLFAGLVAVGAGVAWVRGRPLVPELLWLSLLVYPLWGLVQQWLVQALFVDNVRALTGAPLAVLALLGGAGFGAVHAAHPPLVVATALMGATYVVLFQRWRNLWPMAVCHGWLGTLFYPWVLDLNPAADLVHRVEAWLG